MKNQKLKTIGTSVSGFDLRLITLRFAGIAGILSATALTGCSSDVIVPSGNGGEQTKQEIIIEKIDPSEVDGDGEEVELVVADPTVVDDATLQTGDPAGVSDPTATTDAQTQCTRRACVIIDMQKTLQASENSRLRDLLSNGLKSPARVWDALKNKTVRVRSPLPGPGPKAKLLDFVDRTAIKNVAVISEGSVVSHQITDRKQFAAVALEDSLVLGGGKNLAGQIKKDVQVIANDGTKRTIDNVVDGESTSAPEMGEISAAVIEQAGLSASLKNHILVGSMGAKGLLSARAINLTTGFSTAVSNTQAASAFKAIRSLSSLKQQ